MHGRTQNCLENDHSRPFSCLSVLSYEKTVLKSLLCIIHSGISCTEGLLSCESIAFVMSVLFLSNCITSFLAIICINVLYQLLIFIRSVLYIYHIWIRSQKHYLMEYGYSESAISKVTVTGNKLVIIKEYLRTSYVDIHDHIQNRFVS